MLSDQETAVQRYNSEMFSVPIDLKFSRKVCVLFPPTFHQLHFN